MNPNASGKQFENIFQRVAQSKGYTVIRIPDGCKVVGRNKLIRVKTPFDWILAKDGRVCFIDTKSFAADNCRINDPKLFEPHQIDTMCRFNEQELSAGFLIWLRKNDELVYISASALKKELKNNISTIQNSTYLNIGKLLEPITLHLEDIF